MQAPMQALLEDPRRQATWIKSWRARSTPSACPAHVAIIMDGNGRWARRRGQLRVAGHKAGMQAGAHRQSRPVRRLGIQALTLYAFSIENWKRPRTEVEMLWRLLRTYLRLELPEMMRHESA